MVNINYKGDYMEIIMINRSKIKPDLEQPRKYFDDEKLSLLSQSIKDNGIKDPLKVREKNGQYILIDGERRFRASEGIQNVIPCIVENPENILESQLITSCQRIQGLISPAIGGQRLRATSYSSGLISRSS